jgi:Flp pilus assembly protein TadD
MHEADAALPLARQAAGAEPGVSRAQFVLGRALAETGDAAAGLEHLELAAKLDPGDLETHLALAGALSQTGSTVRARAERLTCVELSRRTAAGAH